MRRNSCMKMVGAMTYPLRLIGSTKNGGDFFRREDSLKQFVFDVARSRAQISRILRTTRAARYTSDSGCGHAGHEREKRRFCCGFDAVNESAPMVRPWKAPKKAIMCCRLL